MWASHGLDRFCVRPYSVIGPELQVSLDLDDQHILRCKGRINNATIPESSKNPVLLPSKHHFSDLIIQDVHKKIMHSGIRQTLVTLRERFWVLRGREAVKRNFRKCIICQRHEGIAFKPPSAPDFPTERVSMEPPFNGFRGTFVCS